jgi:hypothetical protein
VDSEKNCGRAGTRAEPQVTHGWRRDRKLVVQREDKQLRPRARTSISTSVRERSGAAVTLITPMRVNTANSSSACSGHVARHSRQSGSRYVPGCPAAAARAVTCIKHIYNTT